MGTGNLTTTAAATGTADTGRVDVGAAAASASNMPRLSRTEAARVLGVHISSVRRLERAGVLHPERDAQGVVWFDATEVEECRQRREAAAGAVAAKEAERVHAPSEGRRP